MSSPSPRDDLRVTGLRLRAEGTARRWPVGEELTRSMAVPGGHGTRVVRA